MLYTFLTLWVLIWVCSTKRRDYSTIVNGKNPIVAHEFLGEHLDGKDAIIIDDMISSGESMLDVAKQIKPRSNRVFVCTTFGLFTDGFEKFDDYYEKGYIDRVSLLISLIFLPKQRKALISFDRRYE